MDSKLTLNIDIYDACRTNTGRAQLSDMHYDLSKLAKISGADYSRIIDDLQWCAEHGETDMAIITVKNFAQALLSAYEIQESSYKKN